MSDRILQRFEADLWRLHQSQLESALARILCHRFISRPWALDEYLRCVHSLIG
jgi:hypothetical protein